MFTRAFWAATLERAAKSFAQGILVFWGVGDGLFNLWTADVQNTLGVGLGMAVVSVLTSVVSYPLGNKGPSLTRAEILNPQPPK
jgi:hypothetical protein